MPATDPRTLIMTSGITSLISRHRPRNPRRPRSRGRRDRRCCPAFVRELEARVLLSGTAIVYRLTTTLTPATTPIQPTPLKLRGSSPEAIEAGDFNGDGLTDLATVNAGSNNVTVLLAKGDGTLTPQHILEVGRGPQD